MRIGFGQGRATAQTVLGWSLAAGLIALTGCHHAPAEQAIRDTIAAMQAAGEKHDIDGIVAPLSDDFIGSGDEEIGEVGPLDRKTFRHFLAFAQMREGGSVHTRIGPITVALQGANNATATFTVLVTGGSGLLPSDGQVEEVRTAWRLVGSQWKMVSADWKAGSSR